ncbi:MAG: restriction endonuclease subunit S, partial [Lachnospiraceae bacterium]|nr:restriction endonuclease subunit S [Lachnospiraceae bacterium]
MTNAPEIRFKGYTNAWEQRTVGEYGFFYYGKSAPKWSVASDAPTPCVRYGELYAKYNEKIDKILSRTNIPPEQLKFSKGHEVLVPRVGEEPLDFANCSWLSIPDIAIGEMISVYNTEQNPLFVALYFNAMLKHEFAEKVEGGNVSNLYYDRLIDIPVKFPSVKEQELIAMLFDKLNNTIAIYKRKLDGLRELKKAYLQQMFPQAGEAVPRVRFEG